MQAQGHVTAGHAVRTRGLHASGQGSAEGELRRPGPSRGIRLKAGPGTAETFFGHEFSPGASETFRSARRAFLPEKGVPDRGRRGHKQKRQGERVEVIERILGNRSDAAWAARLAGASVDWLELSQWDAQKNRLRKETEGGRSMAVALERGQCLRDGDVLEWDEASRSAVVCRIRLCPVMAVDLTGLAAFGVEKAVSSAVRLGHALGNQHWPAVVKRGVVYVPMTADEKVMSAVMDTHDIAGVTYAFLSGESVYDLLSGEEARLLFGGAESPLSGHDHHHHGHHHV